MSRTRTASIFLLGLLVIAAPAIAQEEGAGTENWEYDVAPYFLWAINLDGEVTVRGIPVDVDASFSDLLDDVDFMFDAHFEARHASGWGMLFEPTYINLSSDGQGPLGDVGIETDVVLFEGMATRRLGASDDEVTLIFGARYTSLDVEIDRPGQLEAKGDRSWTDAVVGLRYVPRLGATWRLSLRGDIGAGGSDLTWNAAALAVVDLSRRVQLLFGYRHMDVDYEDGSGASLFRFDASLAGPLVGVNIAW